jgi:hypothetical protein
LKRSSSKSIIIKIVDLEELDITGGNPKQRESSVVVALVDGDAEGIGSAITNIPNRENNLPKVERQKTPIVIQER